MAETSSDRLLPRQERAAGPRRCAAAGTPEPAALPVLDEDAVR